jgi:hypothetical protein
MPDPVYRYGMAASSIPVAFPLASVPIAFASSGLAVAVWFLSVPVQVLWLDRRRPPEAADWF